MIKLKTVEQTAIDSSFVTLAKQFFYMKMRAYPPRRVEARKILEFYNTEIGFDKFLTRMKLLGYAKFGAVKSNGSLWVKAETKPLIVDFPLRHRKGVIWKYDIGAYSIYIKEDDLLRGRVDGIHFIPQKYPKATIRHLHHRAYVGDNSRIENPLTYYTNTCWGTFGSMIPTIAGEGDLPELFRALLMFVTIQNTSSPLVDYRNLIHYERIDHEN